MCVCVFRFVIKFTRTTVGGGWCVFSNLILVFVVVCWGGRKGTGGCKCRQSVSGGKPLEPVFHWRIGTNIHLSDICFAPTPTSIPFGGLVRKSVKRALGVAGPALTAVDTRCR